MLKNKFLVFLSLIFLLLTFFSISSAEDSITITTYYPSPYGIYNSLLTDKLGVGDNNGDNTLSSADVPTTTGDVWIKGNVGIGTASPGTKLDVQGVNNGNGIRLRNTAGSGIADLYPDSTGNSILELFSSTGVSQVLFRSEGSNSYIASGNVGIGTASPQSKLQVSGDYIQIPTRTNAPPSADCDSSSEYGRMVINETSRRFYICTDSGWDYKMFDNK